MDRTVAAEQPKLLELGERFCVRQEIDNIAWMDSGDGWGLAVDALEHPEKADEVFGQIEQTLGQTPVKYLLNTHTHYDHVALNPMFQARWGTEIINHEVTPLPPEGRHFDGSARKVWMQPLENCHSEQDCLVWVEPDKVLFVGDVFGWGLIPLTTNLRQESAQKLLALYERLIGFEAKVVVPGHGPLATTDHLRRWVRYFNDLVAEVKAAVEAEASDPQILQAPPPADMVDWWRFREWKHDDTLSKVLKAVRRGWL